MAYAEKRGKGAQPWRVKYKLPSGTQASESGFETKAAALAWGRDQEARIREGRWTDANAGKITVSEWIEWWLAMQDVGVSTVDNREYLIRRFIRPAWGASALTPHGLRHSHKTWMAEDGIPEILAEQRLGHQVPGMRGLYAHASDRMRDDLNRALQARWEDSLRARAAIAPRSPVPLLDELLTAEGDPP